MSLLSLASVTDPFGRNHFILIGICIAFIIGGSIAVAKTDIKFSTILNIMLVVWVFSEATKLLSNISYLLSDGTMVKIIEYDITQIQEGVSILRAYYPRTELPFHLCSIQPLFILTIKYTKNEKLKDTLLKFIFPTATLGAIIAIFVGTIGADFTDPQVYEYFGFHAALTVFAIAIVIKKQIKIDLNSHLKTCLMMLIMFIASIWVNSILSDTGNVDDELYTNFFYSMKPPLDNLPILNLNHGWFVYLLTVMAIGIVAITLLQLPFIVKSYKESKTKVEQ